MCFTLAVYLSTDKHVILVLFSFFIPLLSLQIKKKSIYLSVSLLLLTETLLTMYTNISPYCPHPYQYLMASQSISTFPVFHGAVENFHARLLEVPPLFILTCEQIKFHNLRSNHSSVSVSTEVIRIFMEYFSRIMLHPQNTNSAQVVCLSVSCSLKFMSTVS